MVINLGQLLKDRYANSKWQKCFFARVHGVPLCDEAHSFEIREALKFEAFTHRIERSQLRWDPVCRRRYWQGMSCRLHPRECGPEVAAGPGAVTTFPTLLDRVLVWKQQDHLSLLLTMRFFES